MTEDGEDLIRRLHREEIARICNAAMHQQPEEVVNLPDAAPEFALVAEWEEFRRAVPRLLRDGNRGRFAVVKVGHPITAWDTLRDALQAGNILFPQQSCLVQEIWPTLRDCVRLGTNHRWRV